MTGGDDTFLLQEILSECGNRLCMDMGFLTRPVLSLKKTVEKGIGESRCDGTVMTMDSDTVLSRYSENPNLISREMGHMVLHCILGHDSPPSDWAEELAEDMMVEYMLDSVNSLNTSLDEADDRLYACEKVFKESGGVSPKMIAPVLRNMSGWKVQDYIRMFHRDDHSFHRSEDPAKWREMAMNMMVEAEGFSRNLADGGKGMLVVLKVRNRRRHDYREFLRRFMTVRTTVRENPDEFDPVYYAYGLQMYGDMPLIDSVEYCDSPSVRQFVIAVDTSGSTMRGPVERFITEAFQVAMQSGMGRDTEIHVIQCDDEIRSDDIIRNQSDMRTLMSDFELKGGGNTDFRPVFRYVDQLIEDGTLNKLKGMMYFTDGFGTYPEHPPKYEAAFVFCESGSGDREVPPWAMRIQIDPDDLSGEEAIL